MTKKLIIISIVVVVVLLAFAVWLGYYLSQSSGAGPSAYSAVFLSTGDIYFGKLSWFPWPRLTNVWFLQRTAGQNNQLQLGVAPFTSAFWGPMDEVYLNPKQVIFWTSLRRDSQVARALENPQILQQPAPSASTSTFRGPSTPPPSGR